MELHSFQWLVAERVFMRATFIRDWVKGIWGNTPLISDDTPHQYKPLLHVIRFYSSFQTSHRNGLYTALHIHVKLSFCYYLGMEEKKSINYTCARMCNVLKYAIFPFTKFHAFFKDLIMQKKKSYIMLSNLPGLSNGTRIVRKVTENCSVLPATCSGC